MKAAGAIRIVAANLSIPQKSAGNVTKTAAEMA